MNTATRDLFGIVAAIGWVALLALMAAGIHGPEVDLLGQSVPAVGIGILACVLVTTAVLLWPER